MMDSLRSEDALQEELGEMQPRMHRFSDQCKPGLAGELYSCIYELSSGQSYGINHVNRQMLSQTGELQDHQHEDRVRGPSWLVKVLVLESRRRIFSFHHSLDSPTLGQPYTTLPWDASAVLHGSHAFPRGKSKTCLQATPLMSIKEEKNLQAKNKQLVSLLMDSYKLLTGRGFL